MRLSLIYALADCSPVITEAHLRSALAVWDYCRQSASLVFSGSVQAEVTAVPEPLWLKVLNAITEKPGVRRGELTERFKHEANAEGIGAALTYLEQNVMAFRVEVKPEGGGRPAECWYPGSSGEGEADGRSVDTPPLLPSPSDDPWVVRAADAPEETNSEETNSAPASAGGVNFLASGPEETNSAPASAGGVSFLAGVSSGDEAEPEGVIGIPITANSANSEPEPEGIKTSDPLEPGAEGVIGIPIDGAEGPCETGRGKGGVIRTAMGDDDVFDPETNAFAQRLDAAEWTW